MVEMVANDEAKQDSFHGMFDTEDDVADFADDNDTVTATLTYDSVYSDNDVEFTGTVESYADWGFIVKQYDDCRIVQGGQVKTDTGKHTRKVGKHWQLSVDEIEDTDDDGDDGYNPQYGEGDVVRFEYKGEATPAFIKHDTGRVPGTDDDYTYSVQLPRGTNASGWTTVNGSNVEKIGEYDVDCTTEYLRGVMVDEWIEANEDTEDDENLEELRQFRQNARDMGNDKIGVYGDPQTDGDIDSSKETHVLRYENSVHGAHETTGKKYTTTDEIEVRGVLNSDGTFIGLSCDDDAGGTGQFRVDDGGTVLYSRATGDEYVVGTGGSIEKIPTDDTDDTHEARTDGGQDTAEQPRDVTGISDGDTVRIHYESVHGNVGNSQTITLTATDTVYRTIYYLRDEDDHRYAVSIDHPLATQLKKDDTHGNLQRIGYVDRVEVVDDDTPEPVTDGGQEIHPDYRSGGKLAGELANKFESLEKKVGYGDRFVLYYDLPIAGEITDMAAKHGFRVSYMGTELIEFGRIERHHTYPRTDDDSPEVCTDGGQDTHAIDVDGADVESTLRLADRYEGDEVRLEYQSVRGQQVVYRGEIEAHGNKLYVYINDEDTRIIWHGQVRSPRQNTPNGMTVGYQAEFTFYVPTLEAVTDGGGETDDTPDCEIELSAEAASAIQTAFNEQERYNEGKLYHPSTDPTVHPEDRDMIIELLEHRRDILEKSEGEATLFDPNGNDIPLSWVRKAIDEVSEVPEVCTDGGMPPGESEFHCGRVAAGHDTPSSNAPTVVVNHPEGDQKTIEPFTSVGAKATDRWVVYLDDGRKFDNPQTFRVGWDGTSSVCHGNDNQTTFDTDDIVRIEWYGDEG